MKDGLALCICASFLFLDIFIYKGLKLSFQIRIGKLVFTNGYCFPFITCDIIHYWSLYSAQRHVIICYVCLKQTERISFIVLDVPQLELYTVSYKFSDDYQFKSYFFFLLLYYFKALKLKVILKMKSVMYLFIVCLCLLSQLPRKPSKSICRLTSSKTVNTGLFQNTVCLSGHVNLWFNQRLVFGSKLSVCSKCFGNLFFFFGYSILYH